MHQSIQEIITRAETVIAALRRLSEMPEFQPFRCFSGNLNTSMIQFFPIAGERPAGNRAAALPLARLLGGRWTRCNDKWESKDVSFPGFEGVEVVLHYIENSPVFAPAVDLNIEAEAVAS